ncbi:hypothetical protein Tco_0487381 [Tanacetum coccineum]
MDERRDLKIGDVIDKLWLAGEAAWRTLPSNKVALSSSFTRLDALPSTLFEGYDRDFRDLYTRSGAVRNEIFSQRYMFRSLELEQERVTVTFSAIWRPILALEAWAGQTDAQRAALWHTIYDIQMENHDLRMQISKDRRERLDLTDRVARIERRQESRGE